MLLLQGEQAYEPTKQAIKEGTALIKTVCANYKGYTKREVLQTKKACCAQAMIGNPIKKDYRGMISSNLITNCSISLSNVTNAQAIFVPDLASLQGKTVWCIPLPVRRTTWQYLVHWWKQTKW